MLVNHMKTLNDERTRKADRAQTRAHDERYIRKVSGIFLALYLTPKFGKNLHV